MSPQQGRLPGPAAAHAASHLCQEKWPQDVPKATAQMHVISPVVTA